MCGFVIRAYRKKNTSDRSSIEELFLNTILAMSSMTRKTVSALSAFVMVASFVTPAFAATGSNEFAPYADALANAGVISSQTSVDGYRLGDSITRAEMAKIAVNIKQAQVGQCTGNVFTDVSSTLGDLCGYIETAAAEGIVSTKNKNFRPMDLVTRAEMIKMLLAAQGIEPSTTSAGFTDLSGLAPDLVGYINAAAAQGIITKRDSFYPDNTASRGEAFKVASNSAGLTTSSTDAGTTTTSTTTTTTQTTGSGTNTSTTSSGGTDFNLSDLFGNTTGTGTTTTTTTTGTGTTTTTTTTGTGTTITTSTGTTSTGTTVVSTGTTVITSSGGSVAVALDPANPAGESIPKNGSKVYVLAVDFTASSSADALVNGFTIQRVGLSNSQNINQVWAEINGIRVVSSRSLDTNSQAPLVFSNPLDVKAGSTVTVKVYMSMNSNNQTTGDQISFQLSSVQTSGTVAGLPLTGNTFTTTNYTLTPLEVIGTPGSTQGSTYSSVNVGTTGVNLTNNIQLQNNGNGTNSNSDLIINSITFHNDGTADFSQLNNVGLYNAAGTLVSSGSIINGNDLMVSFSGTGFLLPKGSVQNLTLRGDIASAETGRNTFVLSVLRAQDVNVTEVATGFGASVIFGSISTPDTTEYLGNLTINLGQVNISKDPASPSSSTFVPNTKGALVFTADLNLNQAVQAQNGLRIYLTNSNGSNDTYAIAESNISSFKIVLNGSQIDTITPGSGNRFGVSTSDSTTLTAGNAGGYYTNTSFNIPAGANILQIYVDLNNNSSNFTSYTVGLAEGSFDEGLQYLASGRKVNTTLNNNGNSDIVGTATSNTFAIGSSTISVTKADSIGDTSIVRNATQELMRINISNTDVDNVTISSLTLNFARGAGDIASSSEDSKIFFNNVIALDPAAGTGTSITSSPLTSVKKVDASRVLSLTNFIIPKGGSRQISIVGSVESTNFTAPAVTQVTLSNIVSQFQNNSGNPSPSSVSIASANFTYAVGGQLTGLAQQDNVANAIIIGSSTPQVLGLWNIKANIDDLKLDGISFANLGIDTGTTTPTLDTDLSNNNADGGAVAVNFGSGDIAIETAGSATGKLLTAQTAGQGYRVDNRGNMFSALELDESTTGANGTFTKIADLDYNNGMIYRIDSAGQDNNASYSNSKMTGSALIPQQNNNVFIRVQGVVNQPNGNNNLSGRSINLLMNRIVYESASTGNQTTPTYTLATQGTDTVALQTTIDKIFVLRKTQLTFTTPSAVGGALVTGDQSIFRFTATPNASGSADIKRLVFQISARIGGQNLTTGNGPNNFDISGISNEIN